MEVWHLTMAKHLDAGWSTSLRNEIFFCKRREISKILLKNIFYVK